MTLSVTLLPLLPRPLHNFFNPIRLFTLHLTTTPICHRTTSSPLHVSASPHLHRVASSTLHRTFGPRRRTISRNLYASTMTRFRASSTSSSVESMHWPALIGRSKSDLNVALSPRQPGTAKCTMHQYSIRWFWRGYLWEWGWECGVSARRGWEAWGGSGEQWVCGCGEGSCFDGDGASVD